MSNNEKFLGRYQIDEEDVSRGRVRILRDGYSVFIQEETEKFVARVNVKRCRTLKDMTKKEIKNLERIYNTKIIVNKKND